MIDTVFLDAGGVLVHPNWTRVADALAAQGVVVDPSHLAAAEPFAKHRMDTRRVVASTDDHRRGWLYFDEVLSEAGVPKDERTMAAFVELRVYHAAHNLWEHVPADVVPMLESLHALGLRRVVVSNANGTVVRKFERLGLTPHFQAVFDSFDVGVEKPDPRFFDLALERTGSDRATTVHVGDFYHIDVLGARSAGLRAVLVDVANLYADADCPRVTTLAGLVAWVERHRRA
ncbi:MAG: HAD family hydrolase [Vicinamibacterales bacterium]